jgi:hypothetical protein
MRAILDDKIQKTSSSNTDQHGHVSLKIARICQPKQVQLQIKTQTTTHGSMKVMAHFFSNLVFLSVTSSLGRFQIKFEHVRA